MVYKRKAREIVEEELAAYGYKLWKITYDNPAHTVKWERIPTDRLIAVHIGDYSLAMPTGVFRDMFRTVLGRVIDGKDIHYSKETQDWIDAHRTPEAGE